MDSILLRTWAALLTLSLSACGPLANSVPKVAGGGIVFDATVKSLGQTEQGQSLQLSAQQLAELRTQEQVQVTVQPGSVNLTDKGVVRVHLPADAVDVSLASRVEFELVPGGGDVWTLRRASSADPTMTRKILEKASAAELLLKS